MTTIFDGVTFAGSVMLLIGLLDESALKLLGDTKPFLLVSGFAGVLYSLHALGPDE
jgi:hypothetical protein